MHLRRHITSELTHRLQFVLFLCVRLPWVGRDGRLRHSCPDCAVDRPGTTPEMSTSKGCGGGGSSCCCWVRKARYWRGEGRKNGFVNCVNLTAMVVYLVSTSWWLILLSYLCRVQGCTWLRPWESASNPLEPTGESLLNTLQLVILLYCLGDRQIDDFTSELFYIYADAEWTITPSSVATPAAVCYRMAE